MRAVAWGAAALSVLLLSAWRLTYAPEYGQGAALAGGAWLLAWLLLETQE